MIALVFCGDLKYCPYINRYIERIDNANVDHKVFFWNRGGFLLRELDRHYVYFNKSSALNERKIYKLLDFIDFRRWLITQLEHDNPKKVIVLSSLTGVLLERYLNKNNINYIFDIRDYSYEFLKPFYHLEKNVIKNSAFTAISSPGFKRFLPSHEYIIAHNFNRKDIVKNKHFARASGSINFVWNGVVRYFDFQKAYIYALKNDQRFNIIFHGDGPELYMYKQYCSENGFKNVLFTGSYKNSEKSTLLNNAHILNNCYGYVHRSDNKLKHAVSNRFYDGIMYHIPQLVEPDGYKTQWAKKVGIGVSFSPDRSFADKLYNYYENINAMQFDQACDTELNKIIDEDNKFIYKIDEFIKS